MLGSAQTKLPPLTLTSWVKGTSSFQPSLANVWLFVVAKKTCATYFMKNGFWGLVLKSLCYHHQIVDITHNLNKGPGTRTVLTTYGIKNTGICSCTKNKTKKRSFRDCALDRDTFDQRAHVQCHSMIQQKTMMIATSKSHTIARMKTFTLQKTRLFLRINIYLDDRVLSMWVGQDKLSMILQLTMNTYV